MPRDRFSLIRASQGYTSRFSAPGNHPGCHDCRHGTHVEGRRAYIDWDALICARGSFYVQRRCDH